MLLRRLSTCLLACALQWVSAMAVAQTAAQWQTLQIAAASKSEKIMADANTHKGLLARYQVMRHAYYEDNSPAFRRIFGQYVSWYQSFIGDYSDADASFSIGQSATPSDHPSPLGLPGYQARPALTAIPELAKPYRIVLLNEAHNVAITRSLTVQLLKQLRAEGFDYFAAETLYQSDTGLQQRGYPVDNSGFYTEEPVCAEMVRTALKLGFKVVAYEAQSDATGDAREAEQARNLDNAVFKHDPKARLVVDAGYGHIVKSGGYLGGASMAEHLHKLTGLPMLSVEQTMLYPHAVASDNHPIYDAVMQQLHPAAPIVFTDTQGQPWSLQAGYDVSVFFPPSHLALGRPDWLTLGELRRPWLIDGARCQQHYPCLVEARYADESDEAIPADRTVLDPPPHASDPKQRAPDNPRAEPATYLYLRPGKYRLRFSAEDGDQIYQQNITVPARESTNRQTQPTERRDAVTACRPEIPLRFCGG